MAVIKRAWKMLLKVALVRKAIIGLCGETRAFSSACLWIYLRGGGSREKFRFFLIEIDDPREKFNPGDDEKTR